MNLSTSILMFLLLGFFAFVEPKLVQAQSTAAEAVAGDDESETLTRGPLHEAFAEQVNYDPKPGIIIRKQVPEPIEEVPPEVKPDGNNVEWIPGYWAWDDDREDFLWVSGVWRDVPPDRRWVPGYWSEVSEGYQWIAGFWSLADTNEVEYLPYPPESLERGPTSPSPSASHYWVSGCWQYQSQRYLWRPGYWSPYRQDWVWTPAHYNWTPRGAIFIRGYWDYPLVQRGVLFAPVYFPGYANYQRRYQYSPSVVINLSPLLYHLFVQPGHHHYYWGDYYGDRCRRAGYQPNFAFHGRGGYDPLFNYYNTQQRRQGIDYSAHLRERHNRNEQDQDGRPPRTWNEQQDQVARVGNDSPSREQLLAQPLRDVIKDSSSEVRFRQVDQDQRQAWGERLAKLRDLSQRRNSTEANSRTDAPPSSDAAKPLDVGKAPETLQLPPVVGNDRGGDGRGDSEQTKSPPNDSNDSETARSTERTAPDREVSPERNSRRPQREPSDLTDPARTRVDGDRDPHAVPPGIERPEPAPKQVVPQPSRDPQRLPPGIERPEPAPKQVVPQPDRTPRNRSQRTPERSNVVPPAQPNPQLDLPKAGKQQRPPRQAETPQLQPTQPSASSRRVDDNPPRIQPAPRQQAKPENNRQLPDRVRGIPERSRQNNFSTRQSAPQPQAAKPAPQRAPIVPNVQSQGRSRGSSNVPNIRSSGRSQRAAPTSRASGDDGRSKQ